MKLALRFVANAMAVFLALYLVDSVAGGRFVLAGVWAAVIPALLLGFLNSLVRPLHWLRSKPLYALAGAVLTVLVNALILQALVWAGAISSTGFAWVLAAAALVSLVTGAINWLIGFGGTEKARPESLRVAHEQETGTRATRSTFPAGPVELILQGYLVAPGLHHQSEIMGMGGRTEGVGHGDETPLEQTQQTLVEGLHAVEVALLDGRVDVVGLGRVQDHVADAAGHHHDLDGGHAALAVGAHQQALGDDAAQESRPA